MSGRGKHVVDEDLIAAQGQRRAVGGDWVNVDRLLRVGGPLLQRTAAVAGLLVQPACKSGRRANRRRQWVGLSECKGRMRQVGPVDTATAA